MAIRISQLAVEVISTIESNPVADVIQVAVEVATVSSVQLITQAIVDQVALEVAVYVPEPSPPPPPKPTPTGHGPIPVAGMSVQMSVGECTDVYVDPLPAMVTIDCLGKNVAVTGGSKTEVQVSSMCSGSAEYRMGVPDAGTLVIGGFWKIGHPAHQAILQADKDRKPRLVLVTFSDATTWRCLAIVTQRSWSAAVDDVINATYTFKLTGQALELPPVTP
jgi:hypothetical protein